MRSITTESLTARSIAKRVSRRIDGGSGGDDDDGDDDVVVAVGNESGGKVSSPAPAPAWS